MSASAANRGPQIVGVGIAFITISGVTLLLRGISRIATKVPHGLDDWLIVVAAVLSWGYTALCIVEAEDNGYGQHIVNLTAEQIKMFAEELYGLAIIYPMALTFSKLSLLALYWRLFAVGGKRKQPLIILAGLNVAWTIAATLVGIFSCIPVQAQWDASITNKTCIDYYALFLANESITMTFDLAVLLIPIYYISNIQRPLGDRVSLGLTFLLGLIATLISALRLWRLIHANSLPPNDPTWSETDAGLWACIELNIWIVVASIPALRPLVRKLFKKAKEHRSSYSNDSGSTGRTNSIVSTIKGWKPKPHFSPAESGTTASEKSQTGEPEPEDGPPENDSKTLDQHGMV